MTQVRDPNNPKINENDQIGSYIVRRVAPVEIIDAVFYELEHEPTGARHIHVSNSDQENTFSVAFKTVPEDSTGVAHILEHTALCGSKKFPVRDPFFSMIKRSLNTFMNAFTAPDWTMYPFTSQNRKDFYNLMDVYLDAAFFPKLDSLSFKQEGHRVEFEGNELVYKGVVFNEMKGAMSSPDDLMFHALMESLYPDTTYSKNSGGDPAVIPSLSHDDLVAFHRRHYHPSNSYFFTNGNLPLRDHLSFIEEKVLNQFGKIDPQTEVSNQKRWKEPRQVTAYYPLDPSEDTAKKSQVAVAWLLSDARDSFDTMSLALLSDILLGNSASPLRRALIESGLGSALADGSGFEAELKDSLFSCGLKGVDEGDAPTVEKIVFETLQKLAKDGIDSELVEAAIHQLEFRRKEVTNTPYPYGIKLLLSFAGSWFHGGDPLRMLNFEEDLRKVRSEMKQGRFFENKISEYFLENPHRVLLKLLPDQEMAARLEGAEKESLTKLRATLSPQDIEKINQDAETLRVLQETKEDLSLLPTLALSDIPVDIHTAQASEPLCDLERTWWYEQPTSGIFYLTATFGVGSLSREELALVPFFSHAFTKMGTRNQDYIELARRTNLYAGGLDLSPQSRTEFENAKSCVSLVGLNGKCLQRNQKEFFTLLRDLFFEFDFSNLDRLKTLLLEYRAALEGGVVRNGHRLAMSLAARHFSMNRELNEAWHGVHQLMTIKELAEKLEPTDLQNLADKLTLMAKKLLTRNNLNLVLIGEKPALKEVVPDVKKFASGLGQEGAYSYSLKASGSDSGQKVCEGWSTSTAVSFVASSFETVSLGHPDAPSLAVIGKLLRALFLHREIREKGGAYGGFSVYNPDDGVFSMASYRDPHIVRTLETFQGAKEFIRSGDYTADDVKEAILQVCAEIDRPDPPSEEARKSFFRQLIGLSDETRQKFKADLLQVTPEKVREVAELYFGEQGNDSAAVISNNDKLSAANNEATLGLSLNRI